MLPGVVHRVDALAALGFGFIEVGTITPRPQAGNPKPRMFRLPDRQAVINRLGFNNQGVDALVRNIECSRFQGVLGINIGKNKDTPNERAVDDYLLCLERVYPLATYITVNISSPNTQGLRDLQEEATLTRFIGTLREAQEKLAAKHRQRKPMLLKIAPDLTESEMDAIAEVLLASGIDGLICTNTTIDRTAIGGHRHATEAGGLSGAPVFAASTAVLAGMANRTAGKLPIVGVGGMVGLGRRIIGTMDKQFGWMLGVQGTFYPIGSFHHGLQLGAEVVYGGSSGRGTTRSHPC